MTELLRIEGLRAGYGDARVLHGIDLVLTEGSSLALLGRNGAGKTTLLNAIIGVVTRHAGRIHFAGRDVTDQDAGQRARGGIGWVPQERNIFPSLTVEENLLATARPGRWGLEQAYGMFPRLRERRSNMGNQLSGGEQQMLAVARALMLNPRLLLLDEPLEGLAPIIVDELLAASRRIVLDEGVSTIIVEQKARKVLPLTDHAVVLERGVVAHSDRSQRLLEDTRTLDAHLTV